MESRVNFLNIEYVFNRIFDAYLWIKYIILFKIGGGDVGTYLSEHRSESYDGLRDRFHIEDFATQNSGSAEGLGGYVGNTPNTANGTSGGLSSVWNKFLNLFGFGDTASVGTSGAHIANTVQDSGLIHLLGFVRDIMTILGLVTFSIWIYSIIGWKEMVAGYFADYDKAYKKPEPPAFKNSKLVTIDGYMASSDPVQWRLAILEADSMLADLLKTLPIAGIDVGEKLTNANRNNFVTLEDAWDAHKIRNRIAHDGSDFELTERLASDTIKKFKNVFTEFGYGV